MGKQTVCFQESAWIIVVLAGGCGCISDVGLGCHSGEPLTNGKEKVTEEKNLVAEDIRQRL